ncbi:MAG: hypothetical protein K2I10_03940 [Lachnospiraceae bacterium]|nr:hypothetical protein [Lachnospiraceae bacterium]
MKDKKNKSLFFIIGIIIILAAVLLVLFAILLFGGGKKKKGGSGNAGPFVVKESSEKEGSEAGCILEDEIEKDTGRTKGIVIVVNGYKMIIPSDLECKYVEGIGPVVYKDDIFQMKIMVKEGSYDETVRNPDNLTDKVIETGGKILQDVQETELDGKKFVYYKAELIGDKTFVIYTGDNDKHFGGQIVVESEILSDEDLIKIFAGIVFTAQKTDEPDSTFADILNQILLQDLGEEKTESNLSFEGETVNFKVPQGFYSQGYYDSSSYKAEMFWTTDLINVQCSLWSKNAECFYLGAEDYLKSTLDFEMENVKKDTKIETMQIEGNTCYYIDMHYKFHRSDFQKIYAACDYGKNGFFVVGAEAINVKKNISMEMLKEFFCFQKSSCN